MLNDMAEQDNVVGAVRHFVFGREDADPERRCQPAGQRSRLTRPDPIRLQKVGGSEEIRKQPCEATRTGTNIKEFTRRLESPQLFS